jgi:hypothetical protein
MAYASISNWTTTEWNDELEAIARDKFVPLIMSVGASRVEMIRTGELSFSVRPTRLSPKSRKSGPRRLVNCPCP